jgi:hypothetical protein
MAGATSALDFHFTPTSASWLNAVEGFFAKLTRQRLKRGVFQSVVDLQLTINRFVLLGIIECITARAAPVTASERNGRKKACSWLA